MIQTINVSDFRDAFKACGRADQFSYEGLGALFDYLEDAAPKPTGWNCRRMSQKTNTKRPCAITWTTEPKLWPN